MRRTILAALAALTMLTLAAPALAADSRSVAQTRERLTMAHKAHLRAEKREARARYVYEATVAYTARYGASVGRWTWLARDVGWPKAEMATLMYVVDRESGGDAGVFNFEGSGCAGLLQLAPCHYSGVFDPKDPRANLACGLKLWRGSAWAPWALP